MANFLPMRKITCFSDISEKLMFKDKVGYGLGWKLQVIKVSNRLQVKLIFSNLFSVISNE